MQDVIVGLMQIPAVAGLLGGALRALVGWAKSDKPFDWTLTVKPIIIGAVTGLAAGFGAQDAGMAFGLGMAGAQAGSILDSKNK